MTKSVLLAGGAGYVGAHGCKALAAASYEPVSDASRARSELGWVPQMSDIDTIVATAWAWHQGTSRG